VSAPSAAETSDPASRRAVTRAIALLALAAFAGQSMVRVTDSLLPQIAADLSVTVGAASIVVTAYMLSHGLVQLVIGPIGDRFGKYLCIALAAVAATILTFACGIAQSLPALIAARLACGLAVGWIIPLAMAFIGDVIPYERRQQVLGRFLSGQILGQLFGQAAGGVLGDWFGWRRVFFFLAALFAVAALALIVELLRNPVTRPGPASPERAYGFIAGYRAVVVDPWARTLMLAVFLESLLMFGAFAYVGADLHLRFGLSLTVVGLFVGAFAIGGLIYSALVKILVGRLGPAWIAAAGGGLLALGYVTLALEPAWWMAPASVVGIGLGFYMLHNTLQTFATQMTPQARGTALALFAASLYLGQTAGVTLAALAFDRHGAIPVFIVAGLSLLLLGTWFARTIRRGSAARA